MTCWESCWYGKSPLRFLLWPLSLLFIGLSSLRRMAYHHGVLRVQHPGVPVIIVGNISVGGTGKTPLVIELAHRLKQAGYRPGIIARGYRGQATQWPQRVSPDSDPQQVGDEPVVIATRSQCPVVVGPDRVAAVRGLLEWHQACDIVISDDGLQHYRLGRDIEIAVIDGIRRLGNGLRLPAGPLRESAACLKQLDFVIVNNGSTADGEFLMQMQPCRWCHPRDKHRQCDLPVFTGMEVHAIAAIGHPQRFFDLLRQMGMTVIEHALPDHAPLTPDDLRFHDDRVILMTEKDAVKCRTFAPENCWYLEIEAQLEGSLMPLLLTRLNMNT